MKYCVYITCYKVTALASYRSTLLLVTRMIRKHNAVVLE